MLEAVSTIFLISSFLVSWELVPSVLIPLGIVKRAHVETLYFINSLIQSDKWQVGISLGGITEAPGIMVKERKQAVKKNLAA
jgi:hypothetical protein